MRHSIAKILLRALMRLSLTVGLGFALTAPAMATVQVEVQTSAGDFVLELDADKAPKTVQNFLQYVNDKHYHGTIFHHVIDGFMVQGGGFTADMSQKPTRAPIPLEANNGLRNDRGTIAMARTGNPNSATSQFYINVVDNPDLNAPKPDGFGYTVFGKVSSGMETIDKIRALPTASKSGMQNVPLTPVTINAVMVAQVKSSPEPAPAPKSTPISEPTAKAVRDTAAASPKTIDEPAPHKPTPAQAPAIDSAAVRDVEQSVQSWAAAWSSKDMKAYFGAYGRDFDPAGKLSRSAWEDERRARIEGKTSISVKLSELQAQVRGNSAVVRFRQDYRANGISISSRKTLELVRQGDNWKIVREAVGG